MITPAVAGASPSTDTVASVTSKLREIAQQNEALSEQINAATISLAAKQAAYDTAQGVANNAAAEFAAARETLRTLLATQYEGPAFSSTGALLNSASGQSYLDLISNQHMLAIHRSDVLSAVTQAQAAATAATTAANTLLAQSTAALAALKAQQTTLAADSTKYQNLLSTLTAAQKTTYTNYDAPAPAQVAALAAAPVKASTAAAQAAVDFAMAQVGKPYVYGSGGPNSYDCSGLTSAAWRAGGIALPHNAAAQYGYGTHIAESALQPGDLLFFYHPISHVTIYIGNGLMVSAPTSGESVKIITVASSQSIYVGATSLTA